MHHFDKMKRPTVNYEDVIVSLGQLVKTHSLSDDLNASKRYDFANIDNDQWLLFLKVFILENYETVLKAQASIPSQATPIVPAYMLVDSKRSRQEIEISLKQEAAQVRLIKFLQADTSIKEKSQRYETKVLAPILRQGGIGYSEIGISPAHTLQKSENLIKAGSLRQLMTLYNASISYHAPSKQLLKRLLVPVVEYFPKDKTPSLLEMMDKHVSLVLLGKPEYMQRVFEGHDVNYEAIRAVYQSSLDEYIGNYDDERAQDKARVLVNDIQAIVDNSSNDTNKQVALEKALDAFWPPRMQYKSSIVDTLVRCLTEKGWLETVKFSPVDDPNQRFQQIRTTLMAELLPMKGVSFSKN